MKKISCIISYLFMFIAFSFPIMGEANIAIGLALSVLGSIFLIVAQIRKTIASSWIGISFFFIIFSAMVILGDQLPDISLAAWYPWIVYSITSIIFSFSLTRHCQKLDKQKLEDIYKHELLNRRAILLEGNVCRYGDKYITIQYCNNIGYNGSVLLTRRLFNAFSIELDSGEESFFLRDIPMGIRINPEGSSYHMKMNVGELKLTRESWRKGDILLPNNDSILSWNWKVSNPRMEFSTEQGGRLIFYSYNESVLCYYQGNLNTELTMALMALSAYFWSVHNLAMDD